MVLSSSFKYSFDGCIASLVIDCYCPRLNLQSEGKSFLMWLWSLNSILFRGSFITLWFRCSKQDKFSFLSFYVFIPCSEVETEDVYMHIPWAENSYSIASATGNCPLNMAGVLKINILWSLLYSRRNQAILLKLGYRKKEKFLVQLRTQA